MSQNLWYSFFIIELLFQRRKILENAEDAFLITQWNNDMDNLLTLLLDLAIVCVFIAFCGLIFVFVLSTPMPLSTSKKVFLSVI